MLKFFRTIFAASGDKTPIPDAIDPSGNVSYGEGYGFDYQRQETDPDKKDIERDKMNALFFDITAAIRELQSQGIPDFITTALNGGTAFSYAQFAIVRFSGALYLSLVGSNTATPADATKWALLPTPELLQRDAYASAVAAGSANALTAAFSPAIALLPAAPGTLHVMVRAGAANTSATPTFAADGTAAKTIVKGNNAPLVAGDISGAGHWLELAYDATLDRWILLNPAVPFGGFDAVLAPTGWKKSPSGDIEQWGVTTTSASADVAVTFPTPFLTNVFVILVSAPGLGVAVVANYNTPTLTNFQLAARALSGSRVAADVSWRAIGK